MYKKFIIIALMVLGVIIAPVQAYDWDDDGILDSEDDMIEDQDLPGDPDYGIPDWHPKSKHNK